MADLVAIETLWTLQMMSVLNGSTPPCAKKLPKARSPKQLHRLLPKQTNASKRIETRGSCDGSFRLWT